MKKRVLLFPLLLLFVILVTVTGTAVADDEPEYWLDETTLPFDPVPGFEDSIRMWGVLRGAGYRIEVPANWNGDLVMWAHGYRGAGTRLFFNPEEVPFREYLLQNGYAWAASTYAKNDYNVGQGVRDTHRLATFFQRRWHPNRTYMTGASMGGHITAVSIEKYHSFYDGAMPVCGVVGDFELFDFYLDFNVAAQQIGLGTSQFPVDPAYPIVTAPQIKANLEAVPGGWPLVLNADGEGFKQLVELRSGGDRPNFDEAWFFWNSFPEFGSGIPGNFLFDLGALDGTLPGNPGVAVDNTDVVYQTDLDPALSAYEQALNANVVRVHMDPAARRNDANPAVTGNISVPVLTMHNLGDLFVPFHNEIAYADDVARRGNDDLLVQRAIRGVGHCDFTTLEYETAFADLVNWVENGIKPAGDIVSDPSIVAGADYGCQFTDFATVDGHLLPASCP